METSFALRVRPERFHDTLGTAINRPSLAAISRATPIVYVVDDRCAGGESLDALIRSEEWQVRTFESVQEFLASPPLLRPCCLVVDIAMLLDGLELQERLAIDRPGMPIVLITGSCCIPTTVQANSSAELRFLSNPFRNGSLLQTIANALERGRPAFAQWAHTDGLRSRYALLSARERQVLALVVSGKLNKEVGWQLGISEITVKAHRGSLMRKMGAASLPSLVTMASLLGLAVPSTCSVG